MTWASPAYRSSKRYSLSQVLPIPPTPKSSVDWCSPYSKTTYIEWMLAALHDEDKYIVSASIRDPTLYPFGSRKLMDITATCGVASLTGMGIWGFVTFLPLIFPITLRNLHMMVSLRHSVRLLLAGCRDLWKGSFIGRGYAKLTDCL